MVDVPPIDPSLTAAAEAEVKKYHDSLLAALKQTGNLAEASRVAWQNTKNGIMEATNELKNYGSFGKVIEDVNGFFEKHNISLETANKLLVENKNTVSNVISGMMALSNLPVPEYFEKVGTSSRVALGSLQTDYTKTLNYISKLPFSGPIIESMKKLEGFTVRFDAARNAENSLLAMKARAGDLGDTFKKFGNDLSGLDQYMDNFLNQVKDVSDRTGMAPDSVRELAQSLGEIPGRLEGMSEFTDSAGQKMDNLTAVLKISRGTFHDVGKVMEIVTQQYSKFGTSQDNALKLVSRMHSATQQLGMPIANMTTLVSNASSAFKFLGDNSQAALTIMGGLAPALKKSGLGPEAITELVSGVEDGISKLDVAQRAFISAQAGGPGGLQGAAQIQLLQQQGRSDEILNMIKGGLAKQFGGRGAISLQEAAGDQGMAAQRQKQIAFLTQGPFGQLVGGEQQASKLLDAFKAGTADGKALLNAQDATKQAITKGEGEQKRQSSYLQTVTNQLDRLNASTTQMAYLQARQVIGGDNKSVQAILKQSQEFAANDLAIRTKGERVRATEVGVGFKGGAGDMFGRRPQDAVIESTMAAGNLAKESATKIMQGAKDVLGGLFGEEDKTSINKFLTPEEKMPMPQLSEEDSRKKFSQFLSNLNPSAMPERTAPALIHKAAETHAATVATAAHGPGAGREAAKDYNINVNYRGLDDQLRKIAMVAVKDGRVEVESAANGTGPTK